MPTENQPDPELDAQRRRRDEQNLEHLRQAENHIDAIQRSSMFRMDQPQCFQVLEQIRNLLSTAFIKINEGDDKQ